MTWTIETNFIDLATIASPFDGSTTGRTNTTDFCTSTMHNIGTRDQSFGLELLSGATISIGMTSNHSETVHYLGCGGHLPGSTRVTCTDEDVYKQETLTKVETPL